MIYHTTYMSGDLAVKGYLGLPRGVAFDEQIWRETTGTLFDRRDLSMDLIAEPLRPEQGASFAGKRPALLYCRGGMGHVGKVKTHWIEQFIRSGVVVFAPSYRGNEGGEGRDEFGGGEQEDVFSAYRLLRELPFVDSERIAVMGFSRGGINATHTVIGASGVHRLVLWSSVTDLAQTYEERVDLRRMLKRVLGGSPAKRPDAYRLRSPIEAADRIPCPVLLMHGGSDTLVDVGHSLRMHRKLEAIGADVTLHLYPGQPHLFPSPMHEAAVDRMLEWLFASDD